MGISVTGAGGTTYTDTQAQEFRRSNGDAATLERAKAEGFTNAQIAALLGVAKSDVDAFEAAQANAVVNPPAPAAPPPKPTITTRTGHTVTQQEAKEYVALAGFEQAYARAKELEMSHADIATLLEVPISEVDAFESQVRQKADKPSDVTFATDLGHPTTDEQWWAQTLWLRPRNPEVSDAHIQSMTKEYANAYAVAGFSPTEAGVATLLYMVDHGVPVSQYVEAMKDVPGFTREAVEEFLTSQGLPPSPEAWRQVVDNSVILNTRLVLDQKGFEGLDGTGVTVRVLEPMPDTHADMVAGFINHPDFGLAPGATVQKYYLYTPAPGEPSQYPTDEERAGKLREGLQWYIAEEYQSLSQRAEELGQPIDEAALLVKSFSNAVSNMVGDVVFGGKAEQIRDFTQSDAQVLNMSMGNSLLNVIDPILDVADAIVSDSPELSRAIVPDLSSMSPQQYTQMLADFVSDAVFNGQASTQAHREYVEATKEAAQAGKVIVVGVSNEQRKARAWEADGIRLPDLNAFNALAMSDYVIGVGASSTNGTPNTVADDVMSEFSSHGGARYGVTVTTQGQDMAVPFGEFTNFLGYVQGTSFSAPTVAAVVALIKQANPEASFEDIKAWLIANAVDTAAPQEAEGAGMLNLPGVVAQLA